MTLPALRSRLAYWQERLGLSEWRIDLRWMDKKRAQVNLGLSWWHTEEARAQVRVARGSADQEGTLVHELLHIRLEGHREPTTGEDKLYERGLNAIAAALMREP